MKAGLRCGSRAREEAMAACRRVLHGLRQAQWLVRSVGLVQRNVGLVSEVEVGSSSSSSSFHSWSWQEERLGRDVGWSSWRHLVSTSRGLHGAMWGEDGEDEEEKHRSRGEVRGGVSEGVGVGVGAGEGSKAGKVSNEEARNLVQHVHLASLKKKLRDDSRDTISNEELLQLCQTVGMASDKNDASKMAHAFNDAGVVITFRDKVHLHPEKIAEIVANVLPLSLLGEDDQRRMELMDLSKKKAEIDRKAHKQMRVVLWTGLCGLTLQMMIFFRLTFWELSWDVMEPIAFFATGAGIICGYTYFMFTSRDPSYRDFMQRIYHSRQRKLFKKQKFDMKRYRELQMQCETGWKPLTKKILDDAD